ncbi:MAG TPA: glucans biosynthesis glucosyltransferase MdoH [Gammaproteobacteria bacterium]|nr:glucans biosynthesis glucosyltransferase MdoH [Gammaproteobacteria bacterium]
MERDLAVPVGALMARQAAVPPFALLEMPDQDLVRYTRKLKLGRPRIKTLLGRLVTFGGALALTAYATREMIAIVSVGGMTVLQGVMVVLFAITFGWIALSAAASAAGLLFGGVRRNARAELRVEQRTALVMPICNEEPARSFASLQAMAESLIDRGEAAGFEIFVLSDTSNPAVYVRETAAFDALREALGDRMRVWYRRRVENVGRKAGNVREFVTRWGGRYDFMIVLDADSILAAETLVTLVREMAADPRLGLLQTVPRLCGGHTLFARLQQFAGAVYGPIVARGTAAWQGDDGNFWGHNAIIRVRAFASSAGLPVLPGRKPFGGTIMSHDFVEAALLRRAGWSVRMLPTLPGSWEESPPSLLDTAARDRRWAQGNMQHLAVIGSRGLTWTSRAHICIGVMSYLASPLWFALIAVGLAVTAHVATAQFDYFGDEPSLFPRWPRFDSERMIALFIVAMVTLLTPKILGVLRALVNRELLRSVGIVRLGFGVVVETVLSALYAPIMMMIQSRQVYEILRGQDSGWSTQSRKSAATRWHTLLRRHWMHMAAGFAVTAVLVFISMPLLAWMAPALIGLVLALPLSAASGSVLLATLTRLSGFLVIPEEIAVPAVIERRNALEAQFEQQLGRVTIENLLRDEGARQRHFAAVVQRPPAPRGRPDVLFMSARAKVADARSVAEALDWLTPPERLAVLGDHDLFHALVRLAQGGEHTPDRPALRSA